MQWSKAYGGTGDDEAQSVVQTTDGGYIAVGYTNSFGAGNYNFWLVRTDSAGNKLWDRTFGGANREFARSVQQTNDGGYIVSGNTDSFGPGWSVLWLVKTDASGNTMWSKTYEDSDCGYSVERTNDGGYAVSGIAAGADGSIDFSLVKTDASGSVQWRKICGGSGYDAAWSVKQTSDGGYIVAGRTNSFGADGVDFWLVKIAPSNGGPPDDCGWPVLVAPVQISSSGGYDVGDTLTARFTIQNQGTAAIHLDKLLFGGRFNYGGTLPGGGFPDFSYSSVTLQVGQTFQYEGTLYLTEAGHYEFFVAYYIANPTEAERVRCALDPSNWNTCIDLAPGLTDNDRTWSVQVIAAPGNLRAVSIEPVQVVWGADLVQDKRTDFKIGYESTFDVPVEAYIRLETPGFEPNTYPFKYKFAPGSNSFVIGHDVALSPFFLPRTKPEATFRFTIDPGNLVVETDESDNTFPRVDYGRRKVVDTTKLKILFIPVRLREQDGHHWYKDGPYTGYTKDTFYRFIAESTKYLEATYPLAEKEIDTWEGWEVPHTSGVFLTLGASAVDSICVELNTMALVFGFDIVVGVVRPNWFGQIGEPDTTGWSLGPPFSLKGVLSQIDHWNVVAHEIGHVYGLYDQTAYASGYFVAGRKDVNRHTLGFSMLSFMVGGVGCKAAPYTWITESEYGTLLRKLKERGDPEILVVNGAYWKNGTVVLDDFYRLPYGTPDFEEGTIGNHSIVQIDGAGNVLSTIGFNVSFVDAFHNRSFEMIPYIFTIPYNASTSVIQILNGTGHVVASRVVTDNTPSVHIISPNGGEIFTNDQTIQISWEASDLDGDSLVCALSKSEDGGQTWIPIAIGLNQAVYNLTLTGFKGGAGYMVRVIASDGVNTGEDISDGFFTIASFATDVATPPQSVSLGGKANYTLNITSYGGFSNPIVLNATSSTTDELVFRWINGSVIVPVPNGSVEVVLEIEVPYLTEGGNHTVFLSCTSGNNTEVAIAYLFASSHDLAISHITPSKTVVGQGFSMTVNVTVENQGNFGETFTVSLYGNQTLILEGSAYSSPQNSTTLTVTWNTSGFAKGNYTISVVADPVPGETYTADNTLVDGWVFFSIPGDINADRKVDLKDVFAVGKAYGSVVGDSRYKLNLDVNGDGKIDLKDYFTTCKNYGKSW